MSAKSKFRDLKKFKISPAKEPRAMEVIQQDYANTIQNAGQVQYQVHVFESELATLNSKLLDINREGAARRELNEAKAKAEAPTTEPIAQENP